MSQTPQIMIAEQKTSTSQLHAIGIMTGRDILQFQLLELPLAEIEARAMMSNEVE